MINGQPAVRTFHPHKHERAREDAFLGIYIW